MQKNRWRLIANGVHEERVVVEAQEGAPLRYIAGFAKTRRLPEGGALPTEQIQRVVLGWSNQDEAWHLGLVLGSEIAQARGSRWCEIARWPDPETNLYDDLAAQAGEALAQAVSRPFYLVPPRVDEQPPAPQAPVRPLPDLPLTFDLWALERKNDGVLQLVRAGRWARTAVRRILWYTFWTAVYILLVITTFTSGIAPPRPEFLPYLGIASALLLVGLILKNIYQLISPPDRFVADSHQQAVVAMRGSRERWRVSAAQLDSVYVSQVASKIRKNRRTVHYGELNLKLADGVFRHLISVDHPHSLDVDGDSPAEMVDEETVLPLTSDNAYTDLQAAGVYMAQTLGVQCHYDRRL